MEEKLTGAAEMNNTNILVLGDSEPRASSAVLHHCFLSSKGSFLIGFVLPL